MWGIVEIALLEWMGFIKSDERVMGSSKNQSEVARFDMLGKEIQGSTNTKVWSRLQQNKTSPPPLIFSEHLRSRWPYE